MQLFQWRGDMSSSAAAADALVAFALHVPRERLARRAVHDPGAWQARCDPRLRGDAHAEACVASAAADWAASARSARARAVLVHNLPLDANRSRIDHAELHRVAQLSGTLRSFFVPSASVPAASALRRVLAARRLGIAA